MSQELDEHAAALVEDRKRHAEWLVNYIREKIDDAFVEIFNQRDEPGQNSEMIKGRGKPR